MVTIDKLAKDFADALAQKKGTEAFDTQATVRRVEEDTLWVHIPGGTDETPVAKTINAAPGDVVQIRVGGGRAWAVGNATAPPTDNTVANAAASAASESLEKATIAKDTAENAAKAAASAAGAARKITSLTSTTAADVAAKVANGDEAASTPGTVIAVLFENENTALAPTLSVNGSAATPIMTNGGLYAYWSAGSTVIFQYDGTYWQVCTTAVYGRTATIGNPAGGHVYIDADSVDIMDDEDTKLATFEKNCIKFYSYELGATTEMEVDFYDDGDLGGGGGTPQKSACIKYYRNGDFGSIIIPNRVHLGVASELSLVDGDIIVNGTKNNVFIDGDTLGDLLDAAKTTDAGDITSGTLPIARGGTGATTAANAAANLKAVTYATGMNANMVATSGAAQIWALYATCKNSNNTGKVNDLIGLIVYDDHVKIWDDTESRTLFDLKPHSAATQSEAGLMSAADKKKLDGIDTGATAVISGFTTNYTEISIGVIAASNYVSGKSATITKPSGYTHCSISGWYIIGTTRNTWVNVYQLYTDQTKVYCSAANLSTTATSSDTKLRVYLTWVK